MRAIKKQHDMNKLLSKHEIETIYKNYMTCHFPKSELKPLAKILSIEGYLCCDFYDGDGLCGYAFFAPPTEKTILLDYFAVLENKRSRGLGSRLLKEIVETFPERNLILEVENPEFALDESDKSLRERRIGFYRRNGIVASGVKSRVFDDNYLILSAKNDENIAAELAEIYARMFGRESILDGKVAVERAGL